MVRKPISVGSLFIFFLLVLMYGSPVSAQQDENEPGLLEIRGSNNFQFRHVVNSGNEAASPYPFEDSHFFDELNLNATHRASEYDTRRLSLFGVHNNSDFRGETDPFILERWSISQTKGDFAVPYRVKGGDFYSYLSHRTQSRTMKGLQLEVQPKIHFLDSRNSLLGYAGTNDRTWEELDLDDSYSAGFSWLFEDLGDIGNLSLNQVHNSTQPNSGMPDPFRQEQDVFSVAWQKQFQLESESITLESEISHFSGDSSIAAEDRERDEMGYYFQFRGRSKTPLTYRMRYERYGDNFAPEGARVATNRESYEAHVGWRLSTGSRLRGRYQRFENGIEDAVRTDQNVFGLNLSGPFLRPWVKNVSGSVSGTLRFTENETETTDSRMKNLRTNLNTPVGGGWNLRPSLFLQEQEDFSTGGDSRTVQAGLSAQHALNVVGFSGSFSAGVTVRDLDSGRSESTEVRPTTGVNLNRGNHSIGLNLDFQSQQRNTIRTEDVSTYTFASNYDYSVGNHTLGIQFNYFDRAPSSNDDTSAYQVMLNWTVNFGYKTRTDRILRDQDETPEPVEEKRVPVEEEQEPDVTLISRLLPGMTVERAQAVLETYGITGPAELPGAYVYEVQLMDEFEQRQRLALVHDNGLIKRVGLIIDFGNTGVPTTIQTTFERLQSNLVEEYGQPATFLEQGNFSGNVLGQINNDKFIRVMEWTTDVGRLRFGIPRRLDGTVRMELQHARQFPPPQQTLWSITVVQ